MAGDGLEIERKYLLSGAPSKAGLAALGARETRIEQVYLRMTDGWIRRVRRVEAGGRARHILTRKRDVAGIVREELESDLSPEEYQRLLAEADPARLPIRKVRHVIPAGRWTLELDVFDEPPGLVLLEVELERADEVPELPKAVATLVVREVSEDPAYANYNLARRPGAASDEDAGDEDAGEGPAAGSAADDPGDRPDDGPGDRAADGAADLPDELPAAEAARARRRDRDAAAAERKGMGTGLAKQFKQVLDAQAKRGRKAGTPRSTRAPRRARDDGEGPGPPAAKGPARR